MTRVTFIPSPPLFAPMAKSPVDEMMKAENLLATGDFKGAAKIYRKELKSNADNPAANFGMAEAFAVDPQGDVEKAIVHYNKAVEGDPENPMYHALFGRFLVDVGKFNDAEREYRAAAQTDIENSAEYMMELASSYMRVAPIAMEKFMNDETMLIIKRKALGWALDALEITPDEMKKLLKMFK